MKEKPFISRRKSLEQIGLSTVGIIFMGCNFSTDKSPRIESGLYENALFEMDVTRNFLADWFSGRNNKSADSKSFYLDKVLADNFTIVRPNGKRFDKEQTLKIFFEKLYLSDPNVIRHDNRDIHLIFDNGNLVIVGYKESHVYANHEVVNELTAVLVKDINAPNGVKWQLVHETAIEE